jgi:hypothetical protein
MSSMNGSSDGANNAAARLRAAAEELGESARRAGIDSDSPLGVLMGGVAVAFGNEAAMFESWQAVALVATVEARKAAEVELDRLRATTEAAQVALNQAKTAQAILEIQRETLVGRMIGDIAPRLAAGVKDCLVIRERRLNRNLEMARAAAISAVVFALVLGGYVARAVQDWEATEALARCGSAQFVDTTTGRGYCPLDVLLPR